MTYDEAVWIVREAIENSLDEGQTLPDGMGLIGAESLLDSMKLVEVCLALEDAADRLGFEFDWTSDNTMSKSRSMFRSVEALANEFARQSQT